MIPRSSADESVVEFTVRAAVAGIVFGLLFGAANAYLGLRVGLTGRDVDPHRGSDRGLCSARMGRGRGG